MRLFYLLLLFLGVANTAFAKNPQWFVAVYGEHYQHIVGASATQDVSNGVFLNHDFVGKVIYVRSKRHYELDKFRPQSAEKSITNSVSASSASGADSSIDAASSSGVRQDKTLLDTEFGPLVDTGLQYHIDGNFRGWSCANLYVTSLGARIYKLRCEKDMRHE